MTFREYVRQSLIAMSIYLYILETAAYVIM
jgi:hypothetical protein